MAVGQVAGVDPEAWKIVDGKLYLGFSKASMAKWNDQPIAAVKDNIKRADTQWVKLRQQN